MNNNFPPPNTPAETQFRCTIKYMFKGCPKQDGWFGCFVQIKNGPSVRLTGKTTLALTKGMQLDVTAKQTGDEEYALIDMTVVTRTVTGTKAYLMSLPGVSEQTAKKIVQTFGSGAIDLIRNDPERLKSKVGLNTRQMKALTEGVTSTDELNQIRTFLPELYSDAVNYVKKNIPSPKETIKNNPWILLDCPHTSFSVVDTIALRLGVHPHDETRIEKGIYQTLSSMQNGDTYFDLSDDTKFHDFMIKCQTTLRLQFGGGMRELGNRLLRMAEKPDSPIIIRPYKDKYQLYMRDDWFDYKYITDYVRTYRNADYISEPAQMTRLDAVIRRRNQSIGNALTSEQLSAVKMALTKKISVITGGPGRGKTVTIASIAACALEIPKIKNVDTDKQGKILLLAPTGRAVKKLKEDTGDLYPTMTIDRLICSLRALEATEEDDKKNRYLRERMSYSAYNDFDTHIIVDESSMIELSKVAELLSRMNKANFCFVGDKDQLPPVGKGQFFHDLIRSGHIAVSVLTTPFRNNGLILQNADRINNGDTNLQYDVHEMLFYPHEKDDDETLDFILDRYNDERVLEPDPSQIALICPIKKGKIGVISMNMALQDISCPLNECAIATYNSIRDINVFTTKGYEIPDTYYGTGKDYTRFRIGDTVMCVKTNYNIVLNTYQHDDYWNGEENHDIDLGIFNGDTGQIIGYIAPHTVGNDTDSDYILVQFTDGRVAKLDRSNEEFDNFVLGYAMTVHKVQGCEFNTVIYVSPYSLVSMTRTGFACRNLPYTGVTRAKKRVVIIGSRESLEACIRTPMITRCSTLAEEIA